MDLGLRDRACIVTGASRGIGRATALTLAGEGASLLLVARDGEALRAVAEECASAAPRAGARVETLALDVTGQDAAQRVVDACIDRIGRIDALVNNAGTSAARPFEELTDDDWDSQWELNVMAPMRLMRAAAPR